MFTVYPSLRTSSYTQRASGQCNVFENGTEISIWKGSSFWKPDLKYRDIECLKRSLMNWKYSYQWNKFKSKECLWLQWRKFETNLLLNNAIRGRGSTARNYMDWIGWDISDQYNPEQINFENAKILRTLDNPIFSRPTGYPLFGFLCWSSYGGTTYHPIQNFVLIPPNAIVALEIFPENLKWNIKWQQCSIFSRNIFSHRFCLC